MGAGEGVKWGHLNGSWASMCSVCRWCTVVNEEQLYGQILGITSPWKVVDVSLRLEEGEVEASVGQTAAPKGLSGVRTRVSRRRHSAASVASPRHVPVSDHPHGRHPASAMRGRACGYRKRDRFKNAIYFHLGGLDLYPRVGEA